MEATMRVAAMLIGLMLVPAVTWAQDAKLPAVVQAAIDASKKDCGDSAKLGTAFVTEKDINGDGIKDYVLDYGAFECDGSASYFCGTGGCLTQVFASAPGGGFTKVLDENVREIKFSRVRGAPAMVLDLHGSACGKVGAAACPRTLIWDGKTFKKQ